jgi:HAD superfamily hydrolase (TIGR01509 family)
MTGVKALLVDLDGTLVDTAEANFAAYRAALEPCGVTLTREWWLTHGFGRNWRQFLPELLGQSGAIALDVANRKAALYPEFLGETVLNQGLVKLIEWLRPAVRTALVTAASRSATELLLDFHGLRPLFDEVVTGDDVAAHKPSPMAFAAAAERLGVSCEECLVIEDSEVGIAAAAAFGAPCLVVGEFRGKPRERLALAS